MAFTFDAIFAVDPANSANVAKNASITIFDPADVNQSPIAIQDPTGSPLPNPMTLDAAGMGPAFQHPTLARVGWKGAGFVGYFTSYEGMLNETIAAKDAAQVAASEAAGAATVRLDELIAAGEFEGPAGPFTDLTIGTVEATPGNPLTDAIVASEVTAGSATKSALDAAYKVGTVRGKDGKKHKIVAGVIRNDGVSPNFWQLIQDVGHEPLNVDSITSTTYVIDVNFAALGATKVVSFIAGPDEQFAKAGLSVGSSVTLTKASLSMVRTAPVTDYIYYNGSAWVSSTGRHTLAYSTGILTATHSYLGVQPYDVSLTPRGGSYVPVISATTGGVGDSALKIEFRDWNGTLVTTPDANMKVFVSHNDATDVMVNELNTTRYPQSNIWFMGVFEVA